MRTRFDRAVMALEVGTKDSVIAEAKAEAKRNGEQYFLRVKTALDEEAARLNKLAADNKAAEEQAQKNRLADLFRQDELRRERNAAEGPYPIYPTPVPLDIRPSRVAPAATPNKLGGGTFKKDSTRPN